MRIEFWFEFASSYSYPAASRIESLAAARGIGVDWRPFLLGPIFAASGWNDSPFNLYPAKGAYMWRDLERICAAAGLGLRRPSRFPRRSVAAARVALAAEAQPWLPAFVRAVYRANFAEDRDIEDQAVLADCLAEAGQSPGQWLAAAQAPQRRPRLRARTEQAAALGIFGAPTIAVGTELFWGNDRLEQALDWCVSQSASVPPAHGSR